MKKLLRFELKQNLRKPPRVYVRSAETAELYGSFRTDATGDFEGFDRLSHYELMELKQYMRNINAVNKYLAPSSSNMLTDFRLRLPVNFIETLDQLMDICDSEKVEINIFEGIITSIIHQMRIAASKLDSAPKLKALALLDKANIADFKQKHHEQIQSVFFELQGISNRSEKLHHKAKLLFNKDKSYSPLAIKGMATGETLPSKWLVACAIDLLMDETPERIKSFLTMNDMFLLWGKPLKDSSYSKEELIERARFFESHELIDKISL
ncbi:MULTISPECIES: hypothetical protein [Legionella]|uniref:Uncharacterized protein n=1 Tax=Legionella drozanskii LLAP-1 TaxID=1212489 RepID=A0A0W0SLZ6_9GAMM|nr:MULTISPECIES: hypothetical protein [Legionella]KTC84376.1 hypothetical protein Ldro_2979 [Legionella drozanskii LLAP-1]PJE06873.1 MAG: hypothetical protein CK430_14660 [Legionella sp.]